MNDGYAATGRNYWALSPHAFNVNDARVRIVTSSGSYSVGRVGDAFGVRPVVSLRPAAEIDEGEGTYENPYVIG